MVRYYQGVDGLKTGYTENSGYCITTTAKRNDLRLITVVMGEPSSSIRNSETTAMLDYGFNTYQIDSLVKEKQILSKEKVLLGKDMEVNVVPVESVNILNSKVGTKRNVSYEVEIDDIKAPVKVGDVVGKIKVIEDNKTIMEVDATVMNDVDKANMFVIFYRNLIDMMKGTI